MAERFDVAARRHLDTAELLEREGMIEDAGYHYGLVGENAVKQSIVMACGGGPLSRVFWKHFGSGLHEALQTDLDAAVLLANGRLGGGLALDRIAGQFGSRFRYWHVNIRYADTAFPVQSTQIAAWKADAVALLNGGIF